MTERPDGPRTQLRLAVGPQGWALAGGAYDEDGLVELVVSDDGTGQLRRWAVRVPLTVADGVLVAGEPTVEEDPDTEGGGG